MDSSSSWIFLLAIYGAVLSTGLLVLRLLEHRGWVSVSTGFLPARGTASPVVTVRVTNRGRGSVQVTQLDLTGHGPVSIPLNGLIATGPVLPAKIDGLASESWHVDANELKKRFTETGWGFEVRGVVTLTTGQRVWESVYEFTRVG